MVGTNCMQSDVKKPDCDGMEVLLGCTTGLA